MALEAKKLRDKEIRLLAMDRTTIAIEGLGRKLKGRERSDAWRRIYMFVTAPLIVWLTLKAIDLGSYLNPSGKAAYDKLYNSLSTWAPYAIVVAVLGTLGLTLKKDIATIINADCWLRDSLR